MASPQSTIDELRKLSKGWTGEPDSDPPSHKVLDLIQVVLVLIPQSFGVPELSAMSGGIEFCFREYRTYGSLSDQILEMEIVRDKSSERFEFENTFDPKEIADHIVDVLNKV